MNAPNSTEPAIVHPHGTTDNRLIGGPLSTLGRRISHAIESVTAEHGLTADHWYTLELIIHGDGVPMSYIARTLSIPSPTITKFVDHLASLALVFRLSDERDRRRVLVHPSRRGSELYSLLATDTYDAEHSELSRLPLKIRNALIELP